MAFRYNAFISYSQAADRQLTFKVKSALHRLAKPLFRLRALNIFLDQTDLAANPAMWPTIEAALADSEFLVLFASPQAAASPWVRKEVEWWITNRSVDTLLLVLTDGRILWKAGETDFDWVETTALPDNLRNRFAHTPKYVDLRSTKTRPLSELSLRQSDFRQRILELATPLHHRPMAEIDGDDVQSFRKSRRLAWTTIVMLSALLVVVSVLAVYSNAKRREAEDQTRASTAQTLALRARALLAERRIDKALLLSAHAVRLNPSSASVAKSPSHNARARF